MDKEKPNKARIIYMVKLLVVGTIVLSVGLVKFYRVSDMILLEQNGTWETPESPYEEEVVEPPWYEQEVSEDPVVDYETEPYPDINISEDDLDLGDEFTDDFLDMDWSDI